MSTYGRQMFSTEFDPRTGAAYSEYEIPISKRQGFNWIHEHETPKLFQRRPEYGKNAVRSLANTVRSRVVENFSSLTVDHFRGVVAWDIAKTIWEEVVLRYEIFVGIKCQANVSVTRHLVSFYTWRTMAIAYPHEFSGPEYRYKINFKRPNLPVQEYLKGLDDKYHSWVLALRIACDRVDTTDLMAIQDQDNIAVLDLSKTDIVLNSRSMFNERVFRAWSEASAVDGAFSQLRVLLFSWQEQLGSWIFKYINATNFPALTHVVMTNCPLLNQRNREEWEPYATAAGWKAKRAKRSAKSLKPILEDKSFHYYAVSGLYYESLRVEAENAIRSRRKIPQEGAQLDESVHEAESSIGINGGVRSEQRPIVECSMADPHPWTHIIDDFPGTRTVWFDRVFDSRPHDKEPPTQQSQQFIPSLTVKRPLSRDLHLAVPSKTTIDQRSSPQSKELPSRPSPPSKRLQRPTVNDYASKLQTSSPVPQPNVRKTTMKTFRARTSAAEGLLAELTK